MPTWKRFPTWTCRSTWTPVDDVARAILGLAGQQASRPVFHLMSQEALPGARHSPGVRTARHAARTGGARALAGACACTARRGAGPRPCGGAGDSRPLRHLGHAAAGQRRGHACTARSHRRGDPPGGPRTAAALLRRPRHRTPRHAVPWKPALHRRPDMARYLIAATALPGHESCRCWPSPSIW